MPDQTIYTFSPPIINKPTLGLLESGHIIRTQRLVIITENTLTSTIPVRQTSYFVTTAKGHRYTLVVLPVSVLHAWLADIPGVPVPLKEVTAI